MPLTYLPLAAEGLWRTTAPITVVACGAPTTPALLMRSGYSSGSGMIGKNLKVHPNAKVLGIFDEEIKGWTGVHQGHQIREFQDEGFLMAVGNVPPSVAAASFPWTGGEMADYMKDYDKMVLSGVLVEDTGSGHVMRGPGGRGIMRYDTSQHDTDRIVRGMALLAEVLFAAGAKKVVFPLKALPVIDSADDLRKVHQLTVKPKDVELFTVHAMGTVRMGADPARSVVDGFGKAHEAEGLWVCDASVFPGPIGVNPMETIMALSTRAAFEIIAKKKQILAQAA